jgi:predicted membrane-bound dolichyl-phosphate-mannose-protein mannosyltransferase
MRLKGTWELAAIAALTIFFLLFAVFNLGAVTMPSSCWQPSKAALGEEDIPVVFDLGHVQQVKAVYIFLRDAKRTKFDLYGCAADDLEPRSEDWRMLASYDKDPANSVHFSNWDKKDFGNNSVRFLKFVFDAAESDGKIGEILVISAANKKVEVVDVQAEGEFEDPVQLVDEQHFVELPITQKYGAYFDEMYFMRTAEEHLNREEPYEWTHPPLGKLIIASGILTFGMNPFGWRILGVLAAALMIPIIFLLSKRMFKSALMGFFAAFLLTFDFMHFALARLATGEIYIAFFSLLMFYFAFDYFSNREGSEKGKTTSLFLSFVFFGCCFAVKWIAIFGFVAILILLVISDLKVRKPILSDWKTVLAGLLVAAAIYIATYIPPMFAGEGHGLVDVIKLQFYMFGYHSGIDATHPFSSPWWSWPLMFNPFDPGVHVPLWMYSNTFDGTVSSIVLMGNPIIWWCGIPALIFIAARIVSDKVRHIGRDNSVALFILIPFLLQWVPFVLITRILFIYHFMPNVPFMILALTYWVNELHLKASTRKGAASFVILCFLILTSAAVLFFLFYPVISGYPVACEYKESLRWLSSWSF